MELKIVSPQENGFVEEIKWNNEELKAEIASKMKDYRGLVFTEESIAEAKKDRANLNKLKSAFEDERKRVKKLCMEPYNKFEQQVKEVTALICIGVKDGAVIDEKIAMYKKENTKIENQMDVLVSQYMKFETDTYGELKNESSITLVSLYPDLKSDELVKKQIEVYESNNKEIREMKEKKINLKVLKWWLYFGK